MQQSGGVTWAVVKEAIPLLVLGAGIAWALIELRVRKILDARDATLRSERATVIATNREERRGQIDEAKRLLERRIEDVERRFEGTTDDLRRDLDPERRLEGIEERLDKAEARLETLTSRAERLETKMDVFWKAIEQYVPKVFRTGGR